MKHQPHSNELKGHGNLKSYLIGFFFSLILTLIAYFLTSEDLLAGWNLILTLSFLALSQAVIQLLFFLHLGEESSPRWNLVSFLFMFLVVLILVIGTLWIMYNLNYQMV